MKHVALEDVALIADLVPAPTLALSRRQKLERWVYLLKREPSRELDTLERMESLPCDERKALRAENSVLSVAYADPVLRSAGLKGDTVGEAMRFFELSFGHLHELTCSCLNHNQVRAGRFARRLEISQGLRQSRLYVVAGTLAVSATIVAAFMMV